MTKKISFLFSNVLLFMILLLWNNKSMAQQTIGAYPNIDAGFESQAAGNLSTANPPTSTTAWSYVSNGNGQNRSISSSGGNGGPHYLSVGKTNPTTGTSTTVNSNLVGTTNFLTNTTYIIQFHYKQNTGTPDPTSYVFISSDGTSANRISTPISLGTPTTWTKFSATVTTTSTTTQTNTGTTGINIKITGAVNSGNSAVVDIDNFVVYPADNQTTPMPDITAPNSPSSSSVSNITNGSIDVNWGAAAGGTDGGGYVAVRYTANPTGQPDPVTNAVYAVGNSIGTGTVAFVGSLVNFTDAGLNNTSTYYYRIYTTDKAFNYSAAVSTSGTTLGAVAKNYYIDAAGGNDANAGTAALPWQSLNKLNAENVVAGSNIYLKAGSTWTGQQLKFSGSGTSGNPIIIDKYGVGSKPILAGNGIVGQGVVYLFNQSYIEINNLEITNSPNGPVDGDFFVGQYQNGTNPNGADRRGVMVAIDNYGTANHIYLKNLDVHHIKGQLGSGSTVVNGAIPKRTGGIYFDVLGLVEQTATKSHFNDVLINGCNVYYCENIGVAFDNEWNVYYPGGQNSSISADVTEYNNWYDRRFTNVTVSNNTLHHIGKNAMIIRCTDETGLVQYNTCYETALGTTGNTIFTAAAKGTVFQYNEGYYNRANTQQVDPGTIDGSMYDADFKSVGIIFQYSYSHNNTKGIYWGCNTRSSSNNTSGIPDPGDVGCTLRYCISKDDLGDLIFLNYSSAGNEIYNNVFYTSSGISGNIIHENSGNNHTYNYYNNIVYNLSTAQKYAFGSGTGVQTRTISNNVFYGQHPSGATAGEPADPYKITVDPLFTNAGSGGVGLNTLTGYKLQTASPALSSGFVVSNNGGKDYFGNAVPTTTAPNRGFYEGSGSAPLPIKNTYFFVAESNKNALLTWGSAFEQNSSHFDIEHSLDGENFTKIGQVAASGNSTTAKSYSYTDFAAAKGINYYRLKQVDTDRKFTFSAIRTLRIGVAGAVVIFPNPATSVINLSISENTLPQLYFTIYNAEGKLIKTFTSINTPTITLNIEELISGIYSLSIKDSNSNLVAENVQFIKIK